MTFFSLLEKIQNILYILIFKSPFFLILEKFFSRSPSSIECLGLHHFYTINNERILLDGVAHTCNPSIWKVKMNLTSFGVL